MSYKQSLIDLLKEMMSTHIIPIYDENSNLSSTRWQHSNGTTGMLASYKMLCMYMCVGGAIQKSEKGGCCKMFHQN